MPITEQWLRTLTKIGLSQRAVGVVMGRYTFKGRQAEPITSLSELVGLSDVDLLRRPGCGRKTLREIKQKTRTLGSRR